MTKFITKKNGKVIRVTNPKSVSERVNDFLTKQAEERIRLIKNNEHPDNPSFENLSSVPRVKAQLLRHALTELKELKGKK